MRGDRRYARSKARALHANEIREQGHKSRQASVAVELGKLRRKAAREKTRAAVLRGKAETDTRQVRWISRRRLMRNPDDYEA